MGIDRGLSFADARARFPALMSADIDRAGDARGLRALADWMVRYTPIVSLDGPEGLMLETTGCDHLYGGEHALLKRLSAKLEKEGFSHRLAIGETPGAAHALTRGGSEITICQAPGSLKEILEALPVAALRLSGEAVTLLRRFGLTRIGQLYGIDRKALARRFASKVAAEAVLFRLDQALGQRTEALTPLRPAPAYAARLVCPEPVMTAEAIEEAGRRLSKDLCAALSAAGKGARAFHLTAFRADGTTTGIAVTVARPVRDPVHISRLLGERTDRIDPGFGVDLFLLEAGRAGPMANTATALSGDLAAQDMDPAAVSALADRISAKLGDGAVMIRTPEASHIPELSERSIVFEGVWPGKLEGGGHPTRAGLRPLRFLTPPEPIRATAEVPDGPPASFIWRRVLRRIVRADGPERIAPEWWHLDKKAARARDYYRVEDENGCRYWLYRDGLYGDGRGGPPSWYLHGLFP